MAVTEHVDAVREFNRFYTRRLGLLGPGYLGTRHSVAEARVLWELAHAGAPLEVRDLRGTLEMDAGHLSRLLTRLEREGLVTRAPSPGDGRRQRVALTEQGEAAFAALAEHERARTQRAHLRRLKREADAPVYTLPFLFEAEVGLDEYGTLAAKLGRDLA